MKSDQQQYVENKSPKLKIDIQSFLQTLALLFTILGYAFHQNDRITTLEAQLKNASDIQKELTSTQKTIVEIFNTHLVSAAGNLVEFSILKERVNEMEINLKIHHN